MRCDHLLQSGRGLVSHFNMRIFLECTQHQRAFNNVLEGWIFLFFFFLCRLFVRLCGPPVECRIFLLGAPPRWVHSPTESNFNDCAPPIYQLDLALIPRWRFLCIVIDYTATLNASEALTPAGLRVAALKFVLFLGRLIAAFLEDLQTSFDISHKRCSLSLISVCFCNMMWKYCLSDLLATLARSPVCSLTVQRLHLWI